MGKNDFQEELSEKIKNASDVIHHSNTLNTINGSLNTLNNITKQYTFDGWSSIPGMSSVPYTIPLHTGSGISVNTEGTTYIDLELTTPPVLELDYHTDIIKFKKDYPNVVILGDINSFDFSVDDKVVLNISLNKTNDKFKYFVVPVTSTKKDYIIKDTKQSIMFVWFFSNYTPDTISQLNNYDWDYFVEAFPKTGKESTIKINHFNATSENNKLFHDKLIEIDFLSKIGDMGDYNFIDLDWGYLLTQKYKPAYDWVIYYLKKGKHNLPNSTVYYQKYDYRLYNEFDWFEDVINNDNLKYLKDILSED